MKAAASELDCGGRSEKRDDCVFLNFYLYRPFLPSFPNFDLINFLSQPEMNSTNLTGISFPYKLSQKRGGGLISLFQSVLLFHEHKKNFFNALRMSGCVSYEMKVMNILKDLL